jgi:murein DD-endopeptidase MepM/ murein hydrolase activator NlpD
MVGRIVTVVLLVAGLAIWLAPARVSDLVAYVQAPSPHDRYAALLRLRGTAATPQGRDWLEAADRAVIMPREGRTPWTEAGTFDSTTPPARAWRMHARRGQRLVADVSFDGGPLFVDLLRADNGDHLASAPLTDTQLVYDVREDGDVVLRLQPELGGRGDFRIAQRSEASLAFPVEGLTPRAVQSGFGAARDAGRRSHEGVDIFAKAGTPVLAASDGWIGGSTSNGLGGNVVWVWNPFRRLRTYYAHLDRRAVAPGARVSAGDVVGYVGTTGNARGGPPHLHFGVYAAGEGSVDPLPFICDETCGR